MNLICITFSRAMTMTFKFLSVRKQNLQQSSMTTNLYRSTARSFSRLTSSSFSSSFSKLSKTFFKRLSSFLQFWATFITSLIMMHWKKKFLAIVSSVDQRLRLRWCSTIIIIVKVKAKRILWRNQCIKRMTKS